MSETPQQRAGDADDLDTTPSAPQTRTDEADDGPSQDPGGDGLQEPVTEDEIERRQLGDEVESDES